MIKGGSIVNARIEQGNENQQITQVFRSHWLLFVLVGGLLILAGAVAIALPAISSLPPNEILSLVLLLAGIVQVVQAGKMTGELLFAWHLALGLVAAIGGVLVYVEPFPGVVTKMLVMAAVFALHGLTQIAFAARVSRLAGWHWFLLSGLVALATAPLMVMKLPYNHSFTPATLGGVSLAFVGWAYVATSRIARQA
jgi:uncharacterized membrane protein HdeD (DUF308 family)